MEGGPGVMSFADASLLVAVRRGDVCAAREAIRAGANVHARLARQDVLRLLGADTHLGSQWWGSQTDFPWLYVAGKWSTVDVVLLLLRSGCHPSDCTSLGVTALHMAAQEGRPHVAAVLLSAGARADARDFAGWTALHYCANHRWATWDVRQPLEGHLAVVRLLTTGPLPPGYYAALVAATDDDGATAMHSAAQSGRVEMCAALWEAGVPFGGPQGSCTPLHVAASHGRCAVVDQFLSWACLGAKPQEQQQKHWTDVRGLVTSRCDRGDTPALAAAANGQAEVVLLLVAWGGQDALSSSRLLPAAAKALSADTLLVLLALGVRRQLWLAVVSTRLRRLWADMQRKLLAADPALAVEARHLEGVHACEGLLVHARHGTPLVWRPDNAQLYPASLRRRFRDVLRALHGSTDMRQLPPVLRDDILARVFVWEAQTTCWSFITPSQWELVHKAQLIASRRRIKQESVPALPDEFKSLHLMEDAKYGGDAVSTFPVLFSEEWHESLFELDDITEVEVLTALQHQLEGAEDTLSDDWDADDNDLPDLSAE